MLSNGYVLVGYLYRPTGSDQQEDLATLGSAIEADLGPRNFGLATAWGKASILETNGNIL